MEDSGLLFNEDFILSVEGLDELEDAQDIIRASLPSAKTGTDVRSMQKVIELVNKIKIAESVSFKETLFVDPYPIDTLPKHREFFRCGKDYHERLFMAGNRVGKSIAGAYELACHLTGDYPVWWNGRTFDEPIQAWAVGKDARATRDTAQKELLGPIGAWGTGLLPAHTLGKCFALQGTPQAIDIIRVKHKSGGWSELGFKNYQQEIGSFMGTSRHCVWLDEECPLDIYNECNIRTATVNGMMMVTFTPLDGLTPMVVNFCKNADFLVGAKPVVAVDTTDEEEFDNEDYNFAVGQSGTKAVIQAGWDDAPWLTTEVKARLLADTPEHLRKARSEGIPAMGSGNVYTTPIEDILVDPFAIPESWPRMYALDVGWNRTACIWAALDPATDTVYLYDEHYRGQQEPYFHAHAIKSRGEWVPGVIDPASRGRSQADGKRLFQDYKELGLDLRTAKNESESGILAIQQRLTFGKLRVFKTLVNWQKEYMLYSRDKHGRPIQRDDHLMDATRYIMNNLKYMASKQDNTAFTGASYSETTYDI